VILAIEFFFRVHCIPIHRPRPVTGIVAICAVHNTSKLESVSMALSGLAKEAVSIRQVDLPSSRGLSPKLSAHRALCRPVAARQQDAMCKDQVNTPRQAKPTDGGVASVSFLGAGGLEIIVECPKVIFLAILPMRRP